MIDDDHLDGTEPPFTDLAEHPNGIAFSAKIGLKFLDVVGSNFTDKLVERPGIDIIMGSHSCPMRC